MRKIVVLLIVTFLLGGINILQGDVYAVHEADNFSIKTNNDVIHTSVESHQHFISEENNGLFNSYEKTNSLYNIVSVGRSLPVNLLFKEIHAKQIIKNNLSVCKKKSNSYHSRKLHDGYYTCGLGNLRI